MLELALLAAVMGGLGLPADRAEATTLRLEQHWRDPLFATNGQSVRTVSFFEDGGITGVGTENVLVDQMGVTGFLFGVGQNFNWALFTAPPSFAIEGNIFVRYIGGVFDSLRSVTQGGSGLTALVVFQPPTVPNPDSGLRIRATGGAIDFGLVFPLNTLNLFSTEITAVPVPAPVLLLMVAALGLRRISRRTSSELLGQSTRRA